VSDLKPCPDCKRTPILTFQMYGGCWVDCLTPDCPGHEMPSVETKELAIAAWNHREGV
jgi:hypothetical protein